MIKRYIQYFLGSLCLVAFTSSCGDNTIGGGVGEFSTVRVSAAAKASRLTPDILTGNSCSGSPLASTGGSVTNESVDVDITSNKWVSSQTVSLPVVIDRYTIEFLPTTTSTPALSSIQGTLAGLTVKPDETITTSVTVAPESLKLILMNQKNLQPCSSSIYEYYVTITFEGVELGGDGGGSKRNTFKAGLNVAFADRI